VGKGCWRFGTPTIRSRRGRRLGRILSCKRVPANFQHLSKHAQSIAQGAYSRPFNVRPRHRNFCDRELELPGEVEQFWIETPTLDPLLGKDFPRCILCEGFEAALRVFEVKPQDHAKGQIKYTSVELAQQGLSLRLQVRTHPARANRDLRAFLDS